mmetsp:Transcript_35354/g.60551  ORF Transcript_35354/g.60551 Transcript_35354/m.60551 type:complete len:96 (-) Transcript_35354:528-815(-)
MGCISELRVSLFTAQHAGCLELELLFDIFAQADAAHMRRKMCVSSRIIARHCAEVSPSAGGADFAAALPLVTPVEVVDARLGASCARVPSARGPS